jgi:hypothetical protein
MRPPASFLFYLQKKYDYAQYKEKSFFIMFGVLHLFFVIYGVFDFRIGNAKKDLQRFDELVGKKFIPIFRDCSKLDAGKNLTLSIIESSHAKK